MHTHTNYLKYVNWEVLRLIHKNVRKKEKWTEFPDAVTNDARNEGRERGKSHSIFGKKMQAENVLNFFLCKAGKNTMSSMTESLELIALQSISLNT